jgi:transposase
MEEVLDAYAWPYNPDEPLVCFDEMSRQLLDHLLEPLPMEEGQPRREDYEYERKGTANLFLCFQPLTGWRHVEVTERRTKPDFAEQMKQLVDVHFPDARLIHVVLDNLNTHTFASLYEAFPAEEAQRLRKRLVFHYTPRHGSWLNQAEIELSILSRQCLNRRLPDRETMKREVDAWEARRNEAKSTINWLFKVEDARTNLKRLYPL